MPFVSESCLSFFGHEGVFKALDNHNAELIELRAIFDEGFLSLQKLLQVDLNGLAVTAEEELDGGQYSQKLTQYLLIHIPYSDMVKLFL